MKQVWAVDVGAETVGWPTRPVTSRMVRPSAYRRAAMYVFLTTNTVVRSAAPSTVSRVRRGAGHEVRPFPPAAARRVAGDRSRVRRMPGFPRSRTISRAAAMIIPSRMRPSRIRCRALEQKCKRAPQRRRDRSSPSAVGFARNVRHGETDTRSRKLTLFAARYSARLAVDRPTGSRSDRPHRAREPLQVPLAQVARTELESLDHGELQEFGRTSHPSTCCARAADTRRWLRISAPSRIDARPERKNHTSNANARSVRSG
jgi:hypothetical protein